MKKVAIVGVEGSGKTVMLAGLGDLYSRPDDKGYFLAPKDFNTSAYVAELMGRLRAGAWPAATADDVFQGLEWTLRRRADVAGVRPTDICELSCLDFPGEVYRKAFVETTARRSEEMQRKVESLWNYIERADNLIILVNLGDVITHGLTDRRVHESIWVTSAILEQALKERPGRVLPKTAIVLSQADNYEATIKACGGPKGTLEKYLPHVYNSYGWLDVFAAYTVDKTRLADDGAVVPDPAFTTEGLRPIMDWLLGIDLDIKANADNKQDSMGVPDVIGLVCSLSVAPIYGMSYALLRYVCDLSRFVSNMTSIIICIAVVLISLVLMHIYELKGQTLRATQRN